MPLLFSNKKAFNWIPYNCNKIWFYHISLLNCNYYATRENIWNGPINKQKRKEICFIRKPRTMTNTSFEIWYQIKLVILRAINDNRLKCFLTTLFVLHVSFQFYEIKLIESNTLSKLDYEYETYSFSLRLII